MTLKIERHSAGRTTTLRLTGHLRSEHLEELHEQIGGSATQVVLDLEGVTLVDVEAVRFLGACESDGVMLLHCPPYVRQWVHRERQ
jgi:anti-anti-sigma regulatory factor